jgi:4-alpha-glucanotransferase
MPDLDQRASGVLMHLTSLPGPHGIGDLGPAALEFVDFLAEAGQAWWQMLPVGPTGTGNSPYMSTSAFAGNPLLIHIESGKLRPPKFPRGRVDYPRVRRFKMAELRKTFERKRSRRDDSEQAEFESRESDWLEDFALFCALKGANRGAGWTRWPEELRLRRPGALERARSRLEEEVRFHKFLQFVFARQCRALRDYSRRRGIGLIGDVPIFVAHDSADVWANPELFHLDGAARPSLVAGVPPDYFSRTGQLWGNPVYRWPVHRRTGFAWWIRRLKSVASRFDAARLDHFIGFVRGWCVPAGARTARKGRWMRGPGAEFFRRVLPRINSLSLIAEDLGKVTPEVEALRDRFGLPGMRVLQFGFGDGPDAQEPPHRYPRSCVVYTGTHDNDTLAGWLSDLGSGASTRTRNEIRRERERVIRYSGADPTDDLWRLIRPAFHTAAKLVVVPTQDLLGLGTEARMNRPGRPRGNWEWRLPGMGGLARIAPRLAELNRESGRARTGRKEAS